MDVATLGLAIDDSQVTEADAALLKLGVTGEASAARIDRAWKQVQGPRQIQTQVSQLGGTLTSGLTPLDKFNQGLSRMERREPTTAMFALRTGLLQLGTEATGATGPVGRLADSLLLFGTTGAVSLAVLAGFAAVALIIKAFAKEETDAEKAAAELTKTLAKQYVDGLGPMPRHAQEWGTATQSATEAIKKFQTQAANAAWVREAGDGWDFVTMAVARFFVKGTDEEGTWAAAMDALRAKHIALLHELQMQTPDEAIQAGATAAAKFTTAYDAAEAKLAGARTAFNDATQTTAALGAAVEFTRLKWAGYSDTQATLLLQTAQQTTALQAQADALHRLSEEFRGYQALMPIGGPQLHGTPQPATGGLQPSLPGARGRPDFGGFGEQQGLALQDQLVALGVDPATVQSIIQQYGRAFNRGFSDFFAGLETDGIAHFSNLFDTIRSMYTQLIGDLLAKKLMNQLVSVDPSTGLPTLGAKGAAALGAGLVGFGAGQSSGILGGVAAGAVAGATIPGGGPFTAVLGAVSGLVGGLFGDAQKAQQAAEEFHQAQIKFGTDLQAFTDAANGTATSLTASIQQIRDQAEQLRQEAIAAGGQTAQGGGLDDLAKLEADLAKARATEAATTNSAVHEALDPYIALLEQEISAIESINGLEAKRIDQLTQEAAILLAQTYEGYEERLLRAKGLTDEADALALQLQQQQEYTQAVQDGADAAQLAALQEVQLAETRRAALDKLQTQVDGLTSTIDTLTKFQNSLQLGSLTGLSPIQQLQAARAQYQDVVAQAEAGSQTAAGQLPDVAQAFLQASRAVNASGGRYQADFTTVLSDTAQVEELFAGQRTDAQQQIDILQQQLNAMMDINAAIAVPLHFIPDRTPNDLLTLVTATNARLDAITSVLQTGFVATVDAQEDTAVAVRAGTGTLQLQFEGLKL